MDMQRIIGAVFSGFMCKLYAAGLGLWIAYEAANFVLGAFGAISKGFGQ